MALKSDYGLLLRIKVQLIVFYTALETQIIFEILFVLIAG